MARGFVDKPASPAPVLAALRPPGDGLGTTAGGCPQRRQQAARCPQAPPAPRDF